MEFPSFFTQAISSGFVLPQYQNTKQYFPGTECLHLDGKWLLNQIVDQCKNLFSSGNKKQPNLAVILVGDEPSSQVYVANKIKAFSRAGFASKLFKISSSDASSEAVIECIHQLNDDNSCDGVLIQLPLPKHLDAQAILKLIDRKKDVDGFSPENIGLLTLNDSTGIIACTPFGIMMLLSAYGIQLAKKRCVIVGRSSIVGKPAGLLFLNSDATVTFTHSHTENLSFYTREADILVVAAGKKHLIQKDDIKNGAIVIDVGIHKNSDGKLTGDVHPNVIDKASAFTPVPGGIGPTTIAALLLNTAISSIQYSPY